VVIIRKSDIGYLSKIVQIDRHYTIDATKLERELGWKPAETFESGIQKTVQRYLDHQEWTEGVLSGSYRDWLKKQYN
jgi:dTDP-glucose 4,6-dehydratase